MLEDSVKFISNFLRRRSRGVNIVPIPRGSALELVVTLLPVEVDVVSASDGTTVDVEEDRLNVLENGALK